MIDVLVHDLLLALVEAFLPLISSSHLLPGFDLDIILQP